MERGWGLPGAAGDACRNLGRGSSPVPCAHPRLEGLRDRRERDLHTQSLPCLPVPWAGLRAPLLSHLPKPRLLRADTRRILVLPQHCSELLGEAEESLEASQGGGGSSEGGQEILEYPCQGMTPSKG